MPFRNTRSSAARFLEICERRRCFSTSTLAASPAVADASADAITAPPATDPVTEPSPIPADLAVHLPRIAPFSIVVIVADLDQLETETSYLG